jgi:hypothetical protein
VQNVAGRAFAPIDGTILATMLNTDNRDLVVACIEAVFASDNAPAIRSKGDQTCSREKMVNLSTGMCDLSDSELTVYDLIAIVEGAGIAKATLDTSEGLVVSAIFSSEKAADFHDRSTASANLTRYAALSALASLIIQRMGRKWMPFFKQFLLNETIYLGDFRFGNFRDAERPLPKYFYPDDMTQVLLTLTGTGRHDEIGILESMLIELSNPCWHGGDATEAERFRLAVCQLRDGAGIDPSSYLASVRPMAVLSGPAAEPTDGPTNIDAAILTKLSRAGRWSEVRFEFCGDSNYVEIFIQDETAGRYHFDELGFKMCSSNNSVPILAWKMLATMAMRNGSYPSRHSRGEVINPVTTSKTLRAKLKALFPQLVGQAIVCSREPELANRSYISNIKLVDKTQRREDFMDHLCETRGFDHEDLDDAYPNYR